MYLYASGRLGLEGFGALWHVSHQSAMQTVGRDGSADADTSRKMTLLSFCGWCDSSFANILLDGLAPFFQKILLYKNYFPTRSLSVSAVPLIVFAPALEISPSPVGIVLCGLVICHRFSYCFFFLIFFIILKLLHMVFLNRPPLHFSANTYYSNNVSPAP